MSGSECEPWEHLLSDRLLKVAFRTTNEMAWLRDDAIEAIETLERQGKRIYGVDVWIVEGSTVIPVMFDWGLNIAGQDPRFPPTAVEFVRQFSWDIIPQVEESAPYFNLGVE